MRNRITWRTAGHNKVADPYTMNQERNPDPEPTAYESGNPSSWAEAQNTENRWKNDNDRNEVNVPNFKPDTFTHKNSEKWGPEDGAGYDGGNKEEFKRAASQERTAALLVKKAHKAIVIAEKYLGKTASYQEIHDQAVEFMAMPESTLDSSLKRAGIDPMKATEMMGMYGGYSTSEEAEEAGPDVEVKALLNDEPAAPVVADMGNGYCSMCGSSFVSRQANFCTDCGSKRLLKAAEEKKDEDKKEDDKAAKTAGDVPPQFLKNIKKKEDEKDDKKDDDKKSKSAKQSDDEKDEDKADDKKAKRSDDEKDEDKADDKKAKQSDDEKDEDKKAKRSDDGDDDEDDKKAKKADKDEDEDKSDDKKAKKNADDGDDDEDDKKAKIAFNGIELDAPEMDGVEADSALNILFASTDEEDDEDKKESKTAGKKKKSDDDEDKDDKKESKKSKKRSDDDDGDGDEDEEDDEKKESKKSKKRADDDDGDEDEEDDDSDKKSKKSKKRADEVDIDLDDEDEEDEDDKKSKKKGAKTLGGIDKSAAMESDISKLSQIWSSAPDVSDVFGR